MATGAAAPGWARVFLFAVPALLLAGCGDDGTSAEPPAAPTALVAEPVSATVIDLEWSMAGAAQSFEIERAEVVGSFERLATVGGDGRSYTDSGDLEPDRLYRYRIRACRGELCSTFVSGSARTLRQLMMTGATPPPATVSEPYEQTLTAAGGDGSYAWQLASGSLPAGLSLAADAATATISGTPESEGATAVTVRVSSGDGQAAEAEIEIVVTGPAPTDLVVESATMSEIVLSWSAAGDPDSLRLERATAAGEFDLLIALDGSARGYADESVGPDQSYRYRIRSCYSGRCSVPSATVTRRTPAPLAIATLTLREAVVGTAYTQSIAASGGDGVYSWELVDGALPAGLTLGQGTATPNAVISGNPETKETTTFTLRVESGDGQAVEKSFTITVWQTAALVVETLGLPPVMAGGSYDVRLRATGGDPGDYTWKVAAGALPAGLSLNGATIQGTATAEGASPVEIRVSSGDRSATASFTIRVVPNRADRYDITPYPLVEIPAAIQPHVDAAIARWEEALTGNLQAASLPTTFFGESGCGGFGTAVNGTTTDDIIMMINIRPIDGRGSILGQAGPCAIRNADELPIVGILTLDSDDLEPMIGTTTLTSLIFHEMGHVLGFGTLWSGLRVGAATDSSSFTGSKAVAAYRALGGQGNVPLETTGGSGTRDAHWSEAVFDREVMTGFSEAIGVFQPLSRVTIASMADLGYTVDMDVADSFAFQAALMAGDPAAADLGHDVALTWPIKVLDEDGSSRTLDLSARATEPGAR